MPHQVHRQFGLESPNAVVVRALHFHRIAQTVRNVPRRVRHQRIRLEPHAERNRNHLPDRNAMIAKNDSQLSRPANRNLRPGQRRSDLVPL